MRESFVTYAAGEPSIHDTPEDRCKPSSIAGQTWLAGRSQRPKARAMPRRRWSDCRPTHISEGVEDETICVTRSTCIAGCTQAQIVLVPVAIPSPIVRAGLPGVVAARRVVFSARRARGLKVRRRKKSRRSLASKCETGRCQSPKVSLACLRKCQSRFGG